MTTGIGMMIDGVVAILLVVTIGYCILLNRRLKLLKADEQSLRATISELVTATEIAERAIGGLKLTVHECDMGLGERLRKAERISIEMDRAMVSGKDLLGRLSQIAAAGRRADNRVEPLHQLAAAATVAALDEARRGGAKNEAKNDAKNEIKSDTKSEIKSDTKSEIKSGAKNSAKAVAAAAEAFAERLRTKVHGLAA